MSWRGSAMTSKRFTAAVGDLGKPSGPLLASQPRYFAGAPPDSDQLLFVHTVAERHAPALCVASSTTSLDYRRLAYD
jgi:hypothetical protein